MAHQMKPATSVPSLSQRAPIPEPLGCPWSQAAKGSPSRVTPPIAVVPAVPAHPAVTWSCEGEANFSFSIALWKPVITCAWVATPRSVASSGSAMKRLPCWISKWNGS